MKKVELNSIQQKKNLVVSRYYKKLLEPSKIETKNDTITKKIKTRKNKMIESIKQRKKNQKTKKKK